MLAQPCVTVATSLPRAACQLPELRPPPLLVMQHGTAFRLGWTDHALPLSTRHTLGPLSRRAMLEGRSALLRRRSFQVLATFAASRSTRPVAAKTDRQDLVPHTHQTLETGTNLPRCFAHSSSPGQKRPQALPTETRRCASLAMHTHSAVNERARGATRRDTTRHDATGRGVGRLNPFRRTRLLPQRRLRAWLRGPAPEQALPRLLRAWGVGRQPP